MAILYTRDGMGRVSLRIAVYGFTDSGIERRIESQNHWHPTSKFLSTLKRIVVEYEDKSGILPCEQGGDEDFYEVSYLEAGPDISKKSFMVKGQKMLDYLESALEREGFRKNPDFLGSSR